MQKRPMNQMFSPARRDVLKGLGALGLTGAAGLTPRRARAATAMNYMCWEGYDKASIIDPFEAANDVEIAIDLITDSPGGFAKLAAGAWRDFDVVSSDSPWIQRMGPAAIAEFIEAAEFADVYDGFYDQFRAPFAPLEFEGQITGLPTRWGWVGPTVNTEYDSLEAWSSYDPCFDPAYKDKICVLDWGDWPIMPMALHAGINPYEELDDAALNEIRLVLRALFKNTRAVVADLSVAQKGLMDGSFRTLIGGGTYCTSALRKDGMKHIQSIVPEPRNGLKQGIIWMEATGIVKDPVDLSKAKALLRHLVSPEVAVELAWTEATCNLVPSKEAEALFSDDQKDVLQMDYMWEAWDKSQFHNVAPNIDQMLEIWQQELAAAN
ncbi:ABC transporter substrate-binding protein [Pseudotabrizicola sp. L79]|uniref:ABC transporter substrate-binding protein n=1 Tax=Pseudotabrizicola sp. L79 TaxID=3118402 RepID=UPI002F958F17